MPGHNRATEWAHLMGPASWQNLLFTARSLVCEGPYLPIGQVFKTSWVTKSRGKTSHLLPTYCSLQPFFAMLQLMDFCTGNGP